MGNPFKIIIHENDVPKALKQKVLSDIDMIKNTMDIADLLLIQYPTIITGDFSDEPIYNDTE